MYLGQTGQLPVNPLLLLLVVVTTDALIQLRMEAHAMEQGIYQGWPAASVIFNKPAVDALRRIKKQVMEMAESRFILLNRAPNSMPRQFLGYEGARHDIREWWQQWERHSGSYDSILTSFDLWTPLPIAIDALGNRVFEDAATVPARPASGIL
jgi:hypothetical protein